MWAFKADSPLQSSFQTLTSLLGETESRCSLSRRKRKKGGKKKIEVGV